MSTSKKTDAKTAVRSTYGVNRRIAGAYEEALAATCRNGVFVGQFVQPKKLDGQ